MSDHPSVYLWDFTLADSTNVRGDIFEFMRKECTRWCFQKEQGESGYIHYQCRAGLKKRARLNGLLIKMREYGLKVAKKAVSPTSKAVATDDYATFSYVMKDDTRVDGPWDDKQDRKFKTKKVAYIDANGLKPWQQTVVDMARVWTLRDINILIDRQGNLGKSAFTDWCEFYDHGYGVDMQKNVDEMKHEVYSNPHHKCYFVDMEKAWDKKSQREFWVFIESLKCCRQSLQEQAHQDGVS